MRKLGYITALVALAATSVLAATAFAGAAAPFKGTYVGKATEKVNGQSVTALAKGNGTASVLGKSTISGTVSATTANPPCSPFGGPGLIKSAKGTLKVNVTNARGCAASEDQKDNISIAGTVKVKSGTGKFKHAKGSFHFSGRYDRTNGSFNVKLTGTLKY